MVAGGKRVYNMLVFGKTLTFVRAIPFTGGSWAICDGAHLEY